MERLGPHRQGLVIVSVIFVAGASVWLLAARARSQVVRAGFWFENVTFDATEVEADRLGGGVTPVEMKTIERVAMAEVRAAFAGWRIAISADPGAPFKVRVAQELRHPLYLRYPGPAGESAGLWPLGGQGAVNFRLLASNAIRHSPPSADRAAKIAAMGRGIGRAAAHEFAHQILGSNDIHHGRDIQSYEYWNADRREQYYGPMRWDVARPLLEARLKP
jgi:elongation factor P hydroxylase